MASRIKHFRKVDSMRVVVSVIFLLNGVCYSLQDDNTWIGNSPGNSGRIKLRNFDIKHQRRTVAIGEEGYLTDNRQESVNPKLLGGIVIQTESEKLSAGLRWLSNDEIGITKMQAIFDSLPYSRRPTSEKKRLHNIAERLALRFSDYLRVLKSIKITVQHLYSFHLRQAITQRLDCCSLPYRDFKVTPSYGCRVSKSTSCDLIPSSARPGDFNPGRNLTEVWIANVQYFPSLKWLYFISVTGIHNEYPANGFRWAEDCQTVHDTRHRDVFVSTIQPQRKHVVIVVDHGNAMSVTQMRTAKAIALHLLKSFSENDRIAVVGLAGRSSFPRSDTCFPNALVPATVETRFYLSQFVEELTKEDSATNHTMGFETAFQLIQNTFRKGKILSDKALVLYVSRGLLSSLTEAREVMDMIAVHNAEMGHKVIINTYAVIDDGKPIMYEKSFLQDIANQNFSKYDVKYRIKTPVIKGMMLAINNTRDLSSTVGRFYVPLNRSAGEDPVFSLPYLDQADRGLTVSITQSCFHAPNNANRLIGMVGVDLHLEDIVQDITYYNQGDGSYAFVISTSGYTIMHPSFERPIRTKVQPMHTDIRHFENCDGFEAIREEILNRQEGEEKLLLGVVNTTALDGSLVQVKQYYTYIWEKVENVPYIVVIKVLGDRPETRDLNNIHIHNDPDLVYHRLDLIPTENICLHLKQLSTTDISTVYMSPSSFKHPFDHLSQEETKRTVQRYLAYLKDDTRLITNPGLKDGVRNDIAATSRINSEWIRRYRISTLKDYIIRRYMATPSGVFRMFPGTLIDKVFDPTKRSWYTRAMEFPGHVTLTAPYLDVGGAGYIVTISHTIFEGKAAALHSPKDRVVAVMGIDLTLGYFHKLLSESIPACEQSTVRCFLMEDKGYLVAHPGLIDPIGKGPVEQQHVTHKEPLVANDILYHTGFVHKKVCNKYNDRTVQRFYNFNTSLNGVLTNMVHGEHCARYQMTHIPGTNAFLGIVNHTCETATAFCPCSMVDRLCLNCNRMEQNECECPCECPLQMNMCTGQLMDYDDIQASCDHEAEEERLVARKPVLGLIEDHLEQCYQPRCADRKSKLDCLGVLDCEWCQIQSDGKTPVKTAHCASQRICFGGVVGAPTPYGDEISAMAQAFDPNKPKSTPVGPVAGGIMGCFLLVALGVYCYRHHVHRNSHHYISTLPDTQNRMSHYYNEPDDPEPLDEPGAGHTNFVLASFENPASISPYRVNTSYRRPTGGDSDHGYSTMTPHDDSEHTSLPCPEPIFIGKDRYRPHGISKTPMLPPPPNTSRRSRSPTPPHQTRLSAYMPIPEQTMLPSSAVPGMTIIASTSPHSMLANVQVHMVDTH